jgi:hypothetical protein
VTRVSLGRIALARVALGRIALALVAAALATGAAGCKKSGDALILLDLRASGAFPAPVTSVRLSVPWQADAGWPSHLIDTDLGPEGFKFGYYLPGGGNPITIQAEALDAASCVLGSGSLTLPAPPAGGTSQELTLFVRPLADSLCVDAGTPPPPDAGGSDASADGAADGGAPGDAGTDGAPGEGGADGAPSDATPTDATPTDVAPSDGAPSDGAPSDRGAPDAETDAPADAPADAQNDAPVDTASDAPASDAPAGDAPAAG